MKQINILTLQITFYLFSNLIILDAKVAMFGLLV